MTDLRDLLDEEMTDEEMTDGGCGWHGFFFLFDDPNGYNHSKS